MIFKFLMGAHTDIKASHSQESTRFNKTLEEIREGKTHLEDSKFRHQEDERVEFLRNKAPNASLEMGNV